MDDSIEKVILVNEADVQLGLMDKLKAHQQGLLHRAFSLYLFNESGQLLIQRRSLDKYHCPGIWANTCCSHPRNGEKVPDAAVRRLHEELGIRLGYENLKEASSFIYQIRLENDLIEHEYLHVLVAQVPDDTSTNADSSEVMETRWISLEDLKEEVVTSPEKYAKWSILTLEKLNYVNPTRV